MRLLFSASGSLSNASTDALMVRISPSKDRSCRLNVENEAAMWPKSFISNCLSESSSDVGGGRINKAVPLNRDAIGLN